MATSGVPTLSPVHSSHPDVVSEGPHGRKLLIIYWVPLGTGGGGQKKRAAMVLFQLVDRLVERDTHNLGCSFQAEFQGLGHERLTSFGKLAQRKLMKAAQKAVNQKDQQVSKQAR